MKSTSEEELKEWQAMFEERKQKRLTIKAYCQEKGMSLSRFYYYQAMIKKSENSKTVKAQKYTVSDIKPIQIINTAMKENTIIRFILPNNLQCMLPRDMAMHEVKAILGLMLLCS